MRRRFLHSGLRELGASCVAAVLLVWLGCAPATPTIDERVGEQWAPSSYRFVRAEGQRDGEQTHAYFFFEGPEGAKLEVRLLLDLKPEAGMRVGRWYWDRADSSLSGSMTARSVRFLGGQGGPPSVGGTYTLRLEKAPFLRFRSRAVELSPPGH